MSTPYYIYHFENGIRLVHRMTDSPVAHVGVWINSGSRDELPEEQGLAHFIEHMVFKGTKRRTAARVINRLENLGADLNAFTTKEETCVYASILKLHFDKAIELLSDIIFNSTFPEDEIEKEKAVIIDEINSYKDTPSEWIQDEFDEILFPDHPLGRNILGTPGRLKKYSRTDIQRFMMRQYAGDRIVVSSVGNIPFTRVKNLVARYFGAQEISIGAPERTAPGEYKAKQFSKKFGRHQSHIMIGNLAYNQHDSRRVPMALLNNLLGGPAMNSRLNMSLREKHGIAYNLESSFHPLSDTGFYAIYLGTDAKMVAKAIELVNKELSKLMNQSLGVNQLRIAKSQLMGQLAISMESNQNEMIAMGKSLLVYNKVETLEEIIRKIDLVTAAELITIANEVYDPAKISHLIYNQS